MQLTKKINLYVIFKIICTFLIGTVFFYFVFNCFTVVYEYFFDLQSTKNIRFKQKTAPTKSNNDIKFIENNFIKNHFYFKKVTKNPFDWVLELNKKNLIESESYKTNYLNCLLNSKRNFYGFNFTSQLNDYVDLYLSVLNLNPNMFKNTTASNPSSWKTIVFLFEKNQTTILEVDFLISKIFWYFYNVYFVFTKYFIYIYNVSYSLIFFSIFLFFINTLLATFFQNYLSTLGVIRITFFSLIILFIVLLNCCYCISQENATPFFELKLFNMYLPTANFSITFSLNYVSTAFSLLVVTISLCAVLYSRVYLFGDPFIIDFIIKLLWFVFSMLLLVISKNIVMFYLCWEFIGITSMWLINFNSQRLDTLKSALKAFSFNKLSDLALISALLIGYWEFNTTNISDWFLILQMNLCNQNIYTIYHIAFLLLISASIKSAQFGFHIWLPDSMDAPVPASALIHSATLVSAGIYILLLFLPILQISFFLEIVAIMGAVTGAYGGVVAGLQTDLKKALAYSTISHCGFLFVITAVGGVNVTILYLFLHGFFKALAFMCAGEAIRSFSSYQDLNRMGSLFFLTPSISSQLFIAMSNLCGFPFFLGYLFKNKFQNFITIGSHLNVVLEILCSVGLLSSLLYFSKVFYAVVFSFKKYNYKTQSLNNKHGKLFYKFSLKSPNVLIIIFWFIMFFSNFYVYYLFNLKLNDTTFFLGELPNQILNTINVNLINNNNSINYYFFFYTFFLYLIVTILNTYQIKTMSSTFWLFKFNSCMFFFLIIFFIC